MMILVLSYLIKSWDKKETKKVASKLLSNQRGFSLVETFLSSTVMLFGLLNVITSVSIYSKFDSTQEVKMQATNIAESVMEHLIMHHDSSPNVQSGQHSLDLKTTSIATDLLKDYKVEWTVTPDSPVPKIKKIDLMVYWMTGEKLNQVSLTSYRR